MANLNKVMLIGRLTRDPEPILDGKGAKFGFAVNNRKQNQATGQWEDVPVFIDCELWNRGEMGQQATRLLQTVRKGQQVYLEGHLKLDTWTEAPDKGGAKRSQLRVVVDNFQYLEPRSMNEGGGDEGVVRAPRMAATPRKPAAANVRGGDYEDDGGPAPRGAEDDIPF